jgi:hypothetical protein
LGYGRRAVSVHFTPKGPYLAPSDLHMFGPMKEALRGRRFSSDEKVVGEVQKLVKGATKKFLFSDRIKKLVTHWNRCVEVKGYYFKK